MLRLAFQAPEAYRTLQKELVFYIEIIMHVLGLDTCICGFSKQKYKT